MPKKISPEVKARAVRMVAEHQQDYPSVTAAAAAVAKQLGLGRETVRQWVARRSRGGWPADRPPGRPTTAHRAPTAEPHLPS